MYSFLQETLLVHKDLNKSEGLDDLLVELEKEGLNLNLLLFHLLQTNG